MPKGWEWVRLAYIIVDSIGGGTPSKNNPTYWNGTIPWASVKDLNNEIYLSSTLDYITEKGLTNSSSNLIPANNIIICTRMGLGKININTIDVAINQDLRALILSKYICQMYFFYFYKTRNILGQGMTVKGIKQEELLGLAVPIPPLSEQHRIVQKIEDLMALCDELEKALENKAQYKELASKSISNLIQKSENQEQLKANLTLLINIFKEVYSTKANIKDLRDTILQLAIQGKLVPQDPNDEPASVLLKRIEEEKKRLVKEKKIKKATPLPPVSGDERLFELPNGWGYARLGDIGYFENGDRSSEYPKENELVNNGIPFINTKNMVDGYINLNENQLSFITKEKFQALRSGKLVNGDFLFVLRGSVGKNAVFRSNHLYSTGFINTQLLIVRSHLSLINAYLRYFFKSNLYNSQIVQMSSGSAQPQLAASNLKMMVIPLPPISEQQRIVQKADELMILCDELEKHIEATVNHSDNLMKSIIKTAIKTY